LSGSNRRPTVYKTVALPAELKWRSARIVYKEERVSKSLCYFFSKDTIKSMQIVYIADTNGHFSEVFSEYEKRLSSSVKCVRIRAVKHADPRYVAHHETLKAVEWLHKQKKKAIILDEF
jgi:hypothetical protein